MGTSVGFTPSPRKEATAEAYRKARQAEMATVQAKQRLAMNHLSLLERAIVGFAMGMLFALPGIVRSLHHHYGRRAAIVM